MDEQSKQFFYADWFCVCTLYNVVLYRYRKGKKNHDWILLLVSKIVKVVTEEQ